VIGRPAMVRGLGATTVAVLWLKRRTCLLAARIKPHTGLIEHLCYPVAEITCSRGSQLDMPPFSTVVRGRWPGGIVEIVAPTFFNEARARGFPECVCRFNHSEAMPPLASIAGRTLALTVDGIDLDYVAELPESRMDVYESVERGDISGSSFAFTRTGRHRRLPFRHFGVPVHRPFECRGGRVLGRTERRGTPVLVQAVAWG
jgi:hypothetical protein